MLYLLATGSVRGFAFTLGLTTLIDVVVVFLFTHPMLTLLARTKFFGEGHSGRASTPTRLGRQVPRSPGRGRVADRRAARRGRGERHDRPGRLMPASPRSATSSTPVSARSSSSAARSLVRHLRGVLIARRSVGAARPRPQPRAGVQGRLGVPGRHGADHQRRPTGAARPSRGVDPGATSRSTKVGDRHRSGSRPRSSPTTRPQAVQARAGQGLGVPARRSSPSFDRARLGRDVTQEGAARRWSSSWSWSSLVICGLLPHLEDGRRRRSSRCCTTC